MTRICPKFIICENTSCIFYKPVETHSKIFWCPVSHRKDKGTFWEKEYFDTKELNPRFLKYLKEDEEFVELLDLGE